MQALFLTLLFALLLNSTLAKASACGRTKRELIFTYFPFIVKMAFRSDSRCTTVAFVCIHVHACVLVYVHVSASSKSGFLLFVTTSESMIGFSLLQQQKRLDEKKFQTKYTN